MKYTYKMLIAILSPLSLMCASSLDDYIQDESKQKNAFFYTNFGGYYAARDVQGMDIGLGYRYVSGRTGLDINLGGTILDSIVPFVQGSFLVYPFKWSGPYLGGAVSIVPLPLVENGLPTLVNFPFIVGYQTAGESHPVFIQFQYSPFMIPGGTLSLGVGF